VRDAAGPASIADTTRLRGTCITARRGGDLSGCVVGQAVASRPARHSGCVADAARSCLRGPANAKTLRGMACRRHDLPRQPFRPAAALPQRADLSGKRRGGRKWATFGRWRGHAGLFQEQRNCLISPAREQYVARADVRQFSKGLRGEGRAKRNFDRARTKLRGVFAVLQAHSGRRFRQATGSMVHPLHSRPRRMQDLQ
jgi:hypothetical protein